MIKFLFFLMFVKSSCLLADVVPYDGSKFEFGDLKVTEGRYSNTIGPSPTITKNT